MVNDYDEDSEKVFRKLNYFFNEGQAIHFKLKSGKWRNAIIRSIDKTNSAIIIKEFKLGNLTIFFWDIQEETIVAYTIKEGEEKK